MNVLVCFIMCPILERVWGSRSLALFLVSVDVLVMCCIFVGMIVLYAATESEMFLFRAVCGASGLSAGMAVALKQRWPEQPVLPIPGLNRLQCQHLPMVVCAASLVLWAAGWMGGKELPLIFLGTAFSFLLLRFYLKDLDTGVVGDLRPEFAFATLFPDVWGVRGVINLLVTLPFHVLMRAGAFSDALKGQGQLPLPSTSPSTSDATALLVGGGGVLRAVDPQAERRRILAIKAIDEKLAELAKHANAQSQAQQSQSQPAPSQPSDSVSLTVASEDAVEAAQLPGEEELERMEREVRGGGGAGGTAEVNKSTSDTVEGEGGVRPT